MAVGAELHRRNTGDSWKDEQVAPHGPSDEPVLHGWAVASDTGQLHHDRWANSVSDPPGPILQYPYGCAAMAKRQLHGTRRWLVHWAWWRAINSTRWRGINWSRWRNVHW